MKMIKATPVLSGVLAAVMWLVSVPCNADAQGEALFACRSKLMANGVSSNAKVVLTEGYCFAPASCPNVESNYRILELGGAAYDPNPAYVPAYTGMSTAKYTEEQKAAAKLNLPTSCSECTSGGKPKCLKL